MISYSQIPINYTGDSSSFQKSGDYSIIVCIWCPSPIKFPSYSGCGKLLYVYGIYGDLSNLIDDIHTLKNKSVKCPFCNYRFTPYEVYV